LTSGQKVEVQGHRVNKCKLSTAGPAWVCLSIWLLGFF